MEAAQSELPEVGPDDVADILFTSGTTGRSKGAMSAHRQTVGVARAWAELGGVREDDRYLVVNPFFHSFGYKIGIVVGLLTGCTLYPVATFDVEETMRLIEEERITVFPGAPTLYQSLLTAPGRADRDLSSLRLAVTGAAVVPVVLIERMREELAIDQVVTAFGMTEAVVVTMCRDGDSAETVATTNGRAIPGMETRIGADGELLVRGEHVMLGYLDDPAATREAIDEDGWLHTGDIGSLDAQGNLSITDRLKDMYISGGFNVYPAEVEQALLRMDGVTDVAVVGVPDERMGEVGKAFVVGTVRPEDVIAFAKERLANFKVPRQVALVDALPRNLSGKVLKTELRSRWLRGFETVAAQPPQPARSMVEEVAQRPPRNPATRGGTADGPDLSESELAFQAEAREWLAAHVPPEPLPSMDTAEGWRLHQEWEAQLAEARWSVVSWPRAYHGREASLVEWVVFEEEYYRAGAPGRVSQNGIFLLAPIIFDHGTQEQQDRFLPSMATGEQVWAQCWSEPEAGSDLASLTSTARRDEERGGWVLNGQKTWSSRASYAHWGFGLFRSDPSAERHRGLTYFLFPLDADGVTVRPIAQLDGEAGFAEVFFEDVFVPDADVLGAPGDGWRVAM